MTLASRYATVASAVSKRPGILAIKRGMTAMWTKDGTRLPVTLLHVDSVHITDIRPRHNVKADRDPCTHEVQVGAVDKKPRRTKKPLQGHFARAGVPNKYHISSFPVTPDTASNLSVGMRLMAEHFVPGQFVDVRAPTIGKGFQGVMKRWGFKGLRASHGVSVAHRHGGSTGQCQDPGRVFKGKKMPGKMGGKYRTMQCLQVLKVDPELQLVWVKGAVPGFEGQVMQVKDTVKWKAKDIVLPFPTFVGQAQTEGNKTESTTINA